MSDDENETPVAIPLTDLADIKKSIEHILIVKDPAHPNVDFYQLSLQKAGDQQTLGKAMGRFAIALSQPGSESFKTEVLEQSFPSHVANYLDIYISEVKKASEGPVKPRTEPPLGSPTRGA